MELYPLAVRVEITPSLPATEARHEAVRLALRLNAAITWEDQRVNPLDVCSGDCLVCHDGETSEKPHNPPLEPVSGWETTGIAWGDCDG